MLAANRFRNQCFHDQAGNAAVSVGKHLILLVERWAERIERIARVAGKRIGTETEGATFVGRKKCPDSFPADSVLLHQMVLQRHGVEPPRNGVTAIPRYLRTWIGQLHP